jgi:hypothetical protein
MPPAAFTRATSIRITSRSDVSFRAMVPLFECRTPIAMGPSFTKREAFLN